MLKIGEIDDDKQFWDLDVEWNKILRQSSTNNVFLTWEWISTVWKHFGKSNRLKVLYAEDSNRGKLAFAPLRLADYVFGGVLRYRVLEPLAYEISDYTDIIIPRDNDECLSRFLDYLMEEKGWDFTYLADVPETSKTLELLPKVKDHIGRIEFWKGPRCPYLPLSNISITHLQHLVSRGARLKRLRRDYPNVAFKSYDEIGTVEQAFRAFVDLHKMGWKSKGGAGAISTAELFNFYLDISEAFAKKHWLCLDFLMADDMPIAGIYGFTYDGKNYAYLSGWNPEFAEYGVGNIMVYGTIRRCIDLGLKEYDFLRGDEPHKFRWTSKWRQNYHVKIVNKRFESEFIDMCIKTSKFTGIDKIAGKLLKR